MGSKPYVARYLIQIDLSLTINDGARVYGDSGQLSQVFLNLCLNARDALGGDAQQQPYIRIEMDCVSAGDTQSAQKTSGPYARVCITDNGKGMDAETQQRIFDPFFTTIEQHGGWLGLSTGAC